jgi:hypothetical protein
VLAAGLYLRYGSGGGMEAGVAVFTMGALAVAAAGTRRLAAAGWTVGDLMRPAGSKLLRVEG